MDPSEIEKLLKKHGGAKPPPPPSPAPASDIEKLRKKFAAQKPTAPPAAPRESPGNRPDGAPVSRPPDEGYIERLAREAVENTPKPVPDTIVQAPYYLAKPGRDAKLNWLSGLSDSTPEKRIETRYDPQGLPYEVEVDVITPYMHPVGERSLTLGQVLGFSDRSSSVTPSRDPLTPDDIPEHLDGHEVMSIALDPRYSDETRMRANEALTRIMPAGSLQSKPQDRTASPFVKEGVEARLSTLRVDPFYLVNGNRDERDGPDKMKRELYSMYRSRAIRLAPGNYKSDLDVPKDELAAIEAKAMEDATKKYREISNGLGGWNLNVMKDADAHIDNSKWYGAYLGPYRAAITPGVYTVEDVTSTQPGHPVVRHEGWGAFSMRAPWSTTVGAWLFDPNSTWSFGGEHGWGGEQHYKTITYGYQLGDSMEYMRDKVKDSLSSGFMRDSIFTSALAHVVVDVPTLGVMLLEPDLYTVPAMMTGGVAKAARPVTTGVETAKDILKALDLIEDGVKALESADDLDELVRAASMDANSLNGITARSVYSQAQNHIADAASGIPLSEVNPLYDVSNRTVRAMARGDVAEPPKFIPVEARDIGQQHAKVSRVADTSGDIMEDIGAALDGMRAKDTLDTEAALRVISEVDKAAGNSEASDLYIAMMAARQRMVKAADELAYVARFNMARMGVKNLDMPSMIRTGNPRQVLAQLYRNRGELFNILKKAGADFDSLPPAQQVFRKAEMDEALAKARRTLIDNVGDMALARKVAEYAKAQDEIKSSITGVLKRLKQYHKAAKKGSTSIDSDLVEEAIETMAKRQGTWDKIDDLAVREAVARRVFSTTTESYKTFLLKSIEDHKNSVRRFIESGGAVKQGDLVNPVYARLVNNDLLSVDRYLDALHERYLGDEVDTTIASPIGKIIDDLAGRASEGGGRPVRLTPQDIDKLHLFEEALHAENWRLEKLGPQARAETMLNTVKNWKDLGGPFWKRVFTRKESIATPLYQLYHKLTRRFDAAGGSDVGHASARLQEHVRRTMDRSRAVMKEVDDVGVGSKFTAPTDGGDVPTGLDAIREFITTRRRFGNAVFNQDTLTIHQKGFLYLRSILDDDFGADNIIIYAIAGAPAKSFDPVTQSVIGDSIRALKLAIQKSSNADEAMQLAKEYVTKAFLRQKGATDSSEIVDHIVMRAFAYGSVQYDAAIDYMRLFGPGISSEAANLLNWMSSPARSNLALGSADAAFNTAAHLGLPLKGDMFGEWQRVLGPVVRSKLVTTELVKRGETDGFGLFVPASVRKALHEEGLYLAKEMTEFSLTQKNSFFNLLLRFIDHTRFLGIFRMGTNLALPFGNLFGGASWLLLEPGGLNRASKFVFSNAPAIVPWVGLRTPSGGKGLQEIAYETAASHSIATRIFNPTVAKVMFAGDLDEILVLPTGERTTVGRMLREAKEDGVDTFLNSEEMRSILREGRRRRGEADFGPIIDGPPPPDDVPPNVNRGDVIDAEIPRTRRVRALEEMYTPQDLEDAITRVGDEPTFTAPDQPAVQGAQRPLLETRKAPDTIVPPTPTPDEPQLPAWMKPSPPTPRSELPTAPPWEASKPAGLPTPVSTMELMDELQPKLSALADAMRANGHTAEQIIDISDKAIKVAIAKNDVDTILDAIAPHTQAIMGARSALRTPDGRWDIIGDDGEKFLDGDPNFIDEIRGMLREALHIPRDIVERGIASFTGGYANAMDDLVMSASSLDSDPASRVFDIVNHKSAPAPRTPAERLAKFSDTMGNAFSEIDKSSANIKKTIDEFTPGTDAYNARREADANSPEAIERRRIAREELDAEYAQRDADRAAEIERIRRQMDGEEVSAEPDTAQLPAVVDRVKSSVHPPAPLPVLEPRDITPPPPPPRQIGGGGQRQIGGGQPPALPPKPPAGATSPPPPPSPAASNAAKKAARWLGFNKHWVQDFARWVEQLESRARLSYYAGLRLEGVSRMNARERLHRNLGNWSTGLSHGESVFWGRFFSVYRWTRIKMRHLGETIAWSFTKPDVTSARDIMLGKTPVGRLVRLGKVRNNIPNLVDWGDTGPLDDDEQFNAWARRQLPWWEHSGVWLGARPATESEKRFSSLSGRDTSFTEMTLISLQALDELYLLNAFAQAAIATSVELAPFETNYQGVGSGHDAGLAHALSEAAIDEFSRNIDIKWADTVREMLNAAAGNDTPQGFRGALLPADQHVAVKTIMRLVPSIHEFGYVVKDPNGDLRVDSRFLPALQLMVMQLPQISELARATAHGVNVYQDESLAHSLGLIVGDYTGLYREHGFDPVKDHDYDVRERAAELKKALIRADRDAKSDEDRARGL